MEICRCPKIRFDVRSADLSMEHAILAFIKGDSEPKNTQKDDTVFLKY